MDFSFPPYPSSAVPAYAIFDFDGDGGAPTLEKGSALLKVRKNDRLLLLPTDQLSLAEGWVYARCLNTERDGYMPGHFLMTDDGAALADGIEKMRFMDGLAPPLFIFSAFSEEQMEELGPKSRSSRVESWFQQSSSIPLQGWTVGVVEDAQLTPPFLPGLMKDQGVGTEEEAQNENSKEGEVPRIIQSDPFKRAQERKAKRKEAGFDGESPPCSPRPDLLLNPEERQLRLEILKLKRMLLSVAVDRALHVDVKSLEKSEASRETLPKQLKMAQHYLRDPSLISQVLDVDWRDNTGQEELCNNFLLPASSLPLSSSRDRKSPLRGRGNRSPSPCSPSSPQRSGTPWSAPRTYEKAARGWYAKRRGFNVRLEGSKGAKLKEPDCAIRRDLLSPFGAVIISSGALPRTSKGKWATLEVGLCSDSKFDGWGWAIGITLTPPERFSGKYLSAFEVPNSWTVGYGSQLVTSGKKVEWGGKDKGKMGEGGTLGKWDTDAARTRLRNGDRVGILVTSEPPGDLVLYHNNKQRLRLPLGIPANRPVFLTIDLTGSMTKVRFLPSTAPPNVPLRPPDLKHLPVLDEKWDFKC